MARAADHQRGLRNETAGRLRKPLNAVLTDADDGQPARRVASWLRIHDGPCPACAFSFSAARPKLRSWRVCWTATPASRRRSRSPAAPPRSEEHTSELQ